MESTENKPNDPILPSENPISNVWHMIQNLFVYVTLNLFSSSKTIIARIFYFSLTVSIFYIINDSFGFSENYRINTKIEQIEKIENIIKVNRLDKTTHSKIKDMEYAIIEKTTFVHDFGVFLSRAIDTIFNMMDIDNITRNWVVHFLSSGYITFLGMPLLPFIIYNKLSNKRFLNVIKYIGFAYLICIIFISAFSLINYIILPVFDDIIYNYLCNMIVTTLIILFIVIAVLISKLEENGEITNISL